MTSHAMTIVDGKVSPLSITISPYSSPKPCEQKICLRQSVSSVSFAAGTKTYDGLSPTSRMLLDLITHAMAASSFTERALVHYLKGMPHRAHLFPSLIPRLHRLIVDLGTSTESHVYVVPVTSGMMLPVSCFAQAMALYRLCANTCRRVREVYLKRTRSASANEVELGDRPNYARGACLKRAASANEMVNLRRKTNASAFRLGQHPSAVVTPASEPKGMPE